MQTDFIVNQGKFLPTPKYVLPPTQHKLLSVNKKEMSTGYYNILHATTKILQQKRRGEPGKQIVNTEHPLLANDKIIGP